jgi:hypothetical protein
MKTWRRETTACKIATETCLEKTEVLLERKEPMPVEMASAAACPGVPDEDSEAETVGALEDRSGDRHLAVGCRRTGDDGGPRGNCPPPADG